MLLRKIINNLKYKNEYFDVLDEDGNVIGKESRETCHNGSKLLHPVIHVHIFNPDKKLLLQKRSKDKDIQPGKWDTSIGGHVMSGETTNNAIKREALEELGIKINFDKLIGIDKYISESDVEKEYVDSYAYFYDGRIKFQKSDIDEVCFFDLKELENLIEKNETTPNFVKEFHLLKKHKDNFFLF